jgi:hypothetical protein
MPDHHQWKYLVDHGPLRPSFYYGGPATLVRPGVAHDTDPAENSTTGMLIQLNPVDWNTYRHPGWKRFVRYPPDLAHKI